MDIADDVSAYGDEEGVGQSGQHDVEQLMKAWMDERMAPELLESREDVVRRIMENLEQQTEAANILSSRASTKADEHERILLVQAEIERVRWLLRSYLRVRMDKLERFSAYIVRAGETGERGGQSAVRRKLSDVEWGYAERYAALVKQHFVTSVTQNIPERLRRLDEEEMIVKPDLEVAVFARALKNCPAIRLPDGAELEMQKGNIHMLRYKSIRRLLRDGDVRLV